MKNQNVTKEQWRKIDVALGKVIGGMEVVDIEQLKANRKYVIHNIVELYGSWTNKFDCLPAIMQIGAYNPRYLKFVECDIYGRIIKEDLF